MARTSRRRVRERPFEVRKQGISRFDLRDPYHLAVTLSWPGFALATLACLLLINFLFALLYLAQPGAVQNMPDGDFLSALFFSIETLATVGYGEMAPASVYGHIVSAIEILSGMALLAILTGLLFVRFSRPRAKILFADEAVITPHNGVDTLMIRIANGRMNTLTNARAQVGILLSETSAEGLTFRGVHQLPLLRGHLPVFPLTWTLMHPIDEASPLHGLGEEALRAGDARLFLTVQASDGAIAAEVQDLRDYSAEEILFGMRYADIISRDAAGRTVGNVAALSSVQPNGS